MAEISSLPSRARPSLVLVVLSLAPLAGCRGETGANSYQEQQKAQTSAADALREMGATLTEVSNPRGKSWAINLSGKQIADETFDHLRKVGYITDLDLSKTNVGDAQMASLNERKIGGMLLKLNLSNTAVSDAGLAQLTDLMLLTNLNLSGTRMTAAGVEDFKAKRANDPRINPIFKSPTIRLK
jgi:hypothetical protein